MAITTQGWETISSIIGWMYFVAWSASFYPQAILNYQTKRYVLLSFNFSVAGFSLEFALLNPSGFFFYSVYSVAGSVDPYLGTGTVKYNDLLFALHAFAMSSVQLVQIWMYDRGVQKAINKYIIAFLVFLYLCVFTTYIYEASGHPI
jgi:cystinosin